MVRCPIKGYDYSQHDYLNLCEKCDYGSLTPAEYYVHVKNCNRKSNGVYECRFCVETFASFDSVFDHMDIHLKREEYSFECLWCRIRFPSEKKARHHCSSSVHSKDLAKSLPKIKNNDNTRKRVNSTCSDSSAVEDDDIPPAKKSVISASSTFLPSHGKKKIGRSTSSCSSSSASTKAKSVKKAAPKSVKEKRNALVVPPFSLDEKEEEEGDVSVNIEVKPSKIVPKSTPLKKEVIEVKKEPGSESPKVNISDRVKKNLFREEDDYSPPPSASSSLSSSISSTSSVKSTVPNHLLSCLIPHCKQSFDSLAEVMAHYAQTHRDNE